ncbi:type II restriction endonuclease [Dactylosporangium siamense]|uniref:type II restriction endonuclease n=1 Tax=Dactylosporangium siamense TaxID=685454 RepID=UPI001944DD81|nr:type II restriction endonuclease [Dactylosporangium siamense]
MIDWLREQCANYTFDLGGVFRRDSEAATWPLVATGSHDLERQLTERGHLLALPKEPAALANVLEVSIVDYLVTKIHQTNGGTVRRGTERGYPDLEISGSPFQDAHHAIDVKCARRAANGKSTQSRITLYTGNTYFRHPDLPWPGVPRPFNAYRSHLDVIVIYTLRDDAHHRVDDLEIIVQEPWRIASRMRSSKTREYIGAVTGLDALREGRGEFETPEAFYRYWRNFHFKISEQVQKQYQKALEKAQVELEQYRSLAAGEQSS